MRESFLLGFVVLLSLVLGLGALSYYRVQGIEETTTQRSQIHAGLLKSVLTLQEQSGRLRAEVTTLQTARAFGAVTHPASRRVALLEDDIEQTLAEARRSRLAAWPEWAEVERAYVAYRADLDRAVASDVAEARSADVTSGFATAVLGLQNRVQREIRDNEAEAERSREQAQRDILIATAACLAVGIFVSVVSFVETRRRIALLKRAYRSIAQNKELIESTLEGMDSAVLTLKLDGSITRINGTALRVLGFASEREVVGTHVNVVLSDHPPLLALVAPLLESEEPGRRYLGRIELGAERWLFDVGASPLVVGGVVRGFIVVLSDVTEAERAGQELRRNRALMAIGQMTAQVAHEIKNPLGGVRLSAQVLARKLKDDPASLEVIRRIENSVDHLARTVAELNQFARPKELNLEPVRLDRLMDELLEMVGDRVQEKGVEIVRRYDEEVPEGFFDEGELRKAFINFLINALEASEAGGSLKVAVEADEVSDSVRVSVSDEGHGMDDETLRRLFEPFYTTKSSGTGLGMAIARKIVEQHKGRLDVRSSVGEGTTVTVALPLTLVPAPEPAAQERA